MRLDDMSYHYDIFEKVESNGFIVLLTPMYCDIKHLRREYVKYQMFWFMVWIFYPDGTLIKDQRSVLGYMNINIDKITGDINKNLIMQDLGLS